MTGGGLVVKGYHLRGCERNKTRGSELTGLPVVIVRGGSTLAASTSRVISRDLVIFLTFKELLEIFLERA
jgi:hypothetical protein